MSATYLLFDLDGPLTDSKEGILRCVQYALAQCGRPEPDETKLYPFIGPPLSESFPAFCQMSPEETAFAVEQYRKRFSTIGMFENRVYDGVPEMLQRLKAAGKHLAVATSKPEPYTLQILTHFQLTDYFEVIAGSSLERDGETKADVIGYALKRLSIRPEQHTQCMMIGDRKHDAIGAKQQNIPFLGVSYGYAPEGELEAYGASAILPSPTAVADYLLSPNNQ